MTTIVSPTSFTPLQTDILIGSMLGDGHLSFGNKDKNGKIGPGQNSRFVIARSIVDQEYLQWEYEMFKEFCSNPNLIYQDSSHVSLGALNGKTYKAVEKSKIRFQTRSLPIFTALRKEWYGDFTKIIPSSITDLSSQAIAIWLADDGSIGIKHNNRFDIRIFTNGFSIPEVEKLIKILTTKYNEKFRLQMIKQTSTHLMQPIIRCADKASRVLLRDIDPYFPPLSRKSNIWRNSNIFDLTVRVCVPGEGQTKGGHWKFENGKRILYY